jgi:adenylyltransferase/sulfurtransferase
VCGERPTITELVAYDQVCEPAAEAGDMTVEELHRWRTERRPHVLIDVREPAEHEASRIDGAILIPLRQLPKRLEEVPKGQPVVVHCRSGGRSAIAVAMLKLRGYDAHNLSGGILEWERRRAQP